jgi:hypothetical protein
MATTAQRLLHELRATHAAPILPVCCVPPPAGSGPARVIIGALLPADADFSDILSAIARLESAHEADGSPPPVNVVIQAASSALPIAPAEAPLGHP